MAEDHAPTARTRVVREPHRGVYDRGVAYQILDEGFICHVGFVVNGQPFVIPTGYGRSGDNLYIHGSAASRMLRNLDQGIAVCVTVTLLDGLVLARSIFNHSMNYRSVVVLGTAVAVQDATEKLEALRALSDHILPGRWADSRQPNEREIKQTLVMRLPIEPSERNGLRASSQLMIDKITTVSKGKLESRVGRLSDEDIVRVNRAVVVFLGLARSRAK